MGVYLVFLNAFKLSNNVMGSKAGAQAQKEPKLQFTAFLAGDTIMGVYLVFLYTFTLQKKAMGPKTGALA